MAYSEQVLHRARARLEQAKAEFRKRTAGGYTCPIPADAVPAPLD